MVGGTSSSGRYDTPPNSRAMRAHDQQQFPRVTTVEIFKIRRAHFDADGFDFFRAGDNALVRQAAKSYITFKDKRLVRALKFISIVIKRTIRRKYGTNR